MLAASSPVARFTAPERLDLVWTSLNFHDLYDSFMGPADVPQVVAASRRRATCCVTAPNHALRVFDSAIRGRTDQAVLKFRKPRGSPAMRP